MYTSTNSYTLGKRCEKQPFAISGLILLFMEDDLKKRGVKLYGFRRLKERAELGFSMLDRKSVV